MPLMILIVYKNHKMKPKQFNQALWNSLGLDVPIPGHVFKANIDMIGFQFWKLSNWNPICFLLLMMFEGNLNIYIDLI